MNNDVVFKSLQQSYDSLRVFDVINNILYFNYNGATYQLPLNIVSLSSLNPDIFLLKPEDIYRIIYLLELLPKDNLTPSDEEFITQYTEKYLKLEQGRIEERENDKGLDDKDILCLSIPINVAYDPRFVDKRASKIIDEILYRHTEEIESGNFKGQKLVRINPNVPREYSLGDEVSDFGKAGFTTILIILSSVLFTGLYIAYFMIGK